MIQNDRKIRKKVKTNKKKLKTIGKIEGKN